MEKWLKIEGDTFICISCEHQFTIDNKYTTSYFSININKNNNSDKIIKLYENRTFFNWEDNRSRGFDSSIKSIDIYNDIINLTIRSKDWSIKDKSFERSKRLDELLIDDETLIDKKDIK